MIIIFQLKKGITLPQNNLSFPNELIWIRGKFFCNYLSNLCMHRVTLKKFWNIYSTSEKNKTLKVKFLFEIYESIIYF